MIKSIVAEGGYLKITDDFDRSHRISLAAALKAADIPSLTYSQVQAITALASLIAVLIRTLVDRQVLDESFLENDDYDLDAIIYSIEQMGGAYHEPDIRVA